MKLLPSLAGGIAALLTLSAVPALAHPRLIASTPAAKATASNVKQLSLTFSEPLMAPISGIALIMTGMPGVTSHPPMKINGVRTSVGKDGKTLIAALDRPLVPGTYKLDWHAVSTDTHRITGTLSFTVR